MIKKIKEIVKYTQNKYHYLRLLNQLEIKSESKCKTNNSLDLINIEPGELFLTRKPKIINTLVKTGLVVTMYNPRLKIAGISHAMFPESENKLSLSDLSCFKYLDCSFKFLLEWFLNNKSEKKEIIIKIFGGSTVESNDTRFQNIQGPGKQNIQKAEELLEYFDCEVQASNAGGENFRKLVFATKDGQVMVSKIKSEDSKNVSIQFKLNEEGVINKIT